MNFYVFYGKKEEPLILVEKFLTILLEHILSWFNPTMGNGCGCIDDCQFTRVDMSEGVGLSMDFEAWSKKLLCFPATVWDKRVKHLSLQVTRRYTYARYVQHSRFLLDLMKFLVFL